MPNYILNDNIKWALKREARRLFELHATCAESGFPLGMDTVRRGLVPADLDEHLQALARVDARQWKTRVMYGCFEPQREGDRGVLLELSFPHQVTFVWENSTDGDMAKGAFSNRLLHPTAKRASTRIQFDWTTLTADEQAKLIKWVHHAQLQRRRATVARDLVEQFLAHHCNCTGEVIERWPGLRVLFRVPEERNFRIWSERINDPPVRRMSRWNWMSGGGKTVEWYIANAKKIEAADALLQGASLLDKGVGNGDAEVKAKVIAWDMAPLVLAPMPEPVS